MPYVRVTARCIVAVRQLRIAYDPAERVLAPDAHIEEIVSRGCGVRLTARGDFAATGAAQTAETRPEGSAAQEIAIGEAEGQS